VADLLTAAAVIVGIVLVMTALVLVARSARRRGVAGGAIAGAMAAYDEAMHSTAHDTYVEVQAQANRKAPLESRDDACRLEAMGERSHARRGG
jgi:hypothetical protein